jgi:hypothetical protein
MNGGLKMNLRTKYKILKATTIVIGALSIPWGTFIGFCFGEGRYTIGLVALCAQVAISLADGYIWFWVLENMREKIEKEPIKSPIEAPI